MVYTHDQDNPAEDGYWMNIEHEHFTDESEALAEIEAAGYFPVTIDFPAESNEDHWHDFDSMVYILSGEVTVTETETGESCTCGQGTRIVASAGILHREQTSGHRALIGLSVSPERLTQPVNKPPPVGTA
jgi:quercetin dioxygenase-like cupin family protein